MRVKLSSSPPLPPVRAWFALPSAHGQTVSAFKSLLCTSLPTFRGVSPTSLRLSIDGFELLDNSELTIVRDGDLISVDARETQVGPSHKRKRQTSTTSGSESDTTSSSSSESDPSSESESDSSPSLRQTRPASKLASTLSSISTSGRSTFVPPGYGKPQTRARNLRRRLKRVHERKGEDGPLSGANAVVPTTNATHDVPALMSLSLRNKNKAKNFKSLMGRPLPPKIIFGDEQAPPLPRLIPPSSRSSLPTNMFVTSVDVEAEDEDEDDANVDVDVERLEAMANERWDTLARPSRDTRIGAFIGYKALGIDPVTYTPGHVMTVARVESCDDVGMAVRPLRAVAFHGPVDDAEAESYVWAEIGDWRVLA